MFDLDLYKAVLWLIPSRLRTTFNVAWLKALISPLVTQYNSFITYRTEIQYKLNHNGQVCYLEAVLNDTFDVDERRIYLEDAGGESVTLLQRDTDLEPVILNDDDTGAVIIHNDSAYNGGDYNGIVYIPYQFTDAELYRLRALVDSYRLATIKYDVVVSD